MSQDFFDDEFEKMEKERAEKEKAAQEVKEKAEQERQKAMDDWYGYGASANGGNGGQTHSSVKPTAKPWYVVLICIALVFAIALGWVLCALFGGAGNVSGQKEQQRYVQTVVNAVCQVLNKDLPSGSKISLSQQQLEEIFALASNSADSGQLYNEAILSNVFDYLRTAYYKDISESQWQEAVAKAGTALIQSAGDRFCQLMSPQAYYDFINQVSNTTVVGGSDRGYFGITYTYSDGLGLYVSDVVTDSSCYGLLQSGDIVLKLTNLTYNEQVITQNGLHIDRPSEIVFADLDMETASTYMAVIDQAKFRYLRNGDVHDSSVIARGGVGIDIIKPGYDFNFIEFYFSDACKNVSTSSDRANNTYDLRHLENLPSDAGYVRITEFMYTVDGTTQTTVADEFREVMKLFKQSGKKRLVLDLKGNPGGLVDAVCDIAGMLVCDQKLTQAEKSQVARGNQLLITSLVDRNGKTQTSYRTPSYTEYFGDPSNVCSIVVWTDANSASASELLTGALRDYGTGFQIGSKTYGKGIAQTYEPLPYTGKIVKTNGTIGTGHWAIYYTFAAYYSPLGENIHGTGYPPTAGYDRINDYETLWQKTLQYWH